MGALQDILRGLLPSRPQPSIEEEMEGATPHARGAAFARAGDTARDAGDRTRALALYGLAVDAYLRAGRGRAAELICQRLIALDPKVVRARYTLTAIAIGRDDVYEAAERTAAYVDAVTEAGVADLAVPSLVRLAGATDNPVLRGYVASALRDLGRDELAMGVELGTVAPPPEGTRWSLAVAAATGPPS